MGPELIRIGMALSKLTESYNPRDNILNIDVKVDSILQIQKRKICCVLIL
jgi:hypothetical protein